MNCLHNAMIGAVLIFGLVMLIEASDNGASVDILRQVSDVREESIREKRDTDCTLSTSNTVCTFTCETLGVLSVCLTATWESADAVLIEGKVAGTTLISQRLTRVANHVMVNPPSNKTHRFRIMERSEPGDNVNICYFFL